MFADEGDGGFAFEQLHVSPTWTNLDHAHGAARLDSGHPPQIQDVSANIVHCCSHHRQVSLSEIC